MFDPLWEFGGHPVLPLVYSAGVFSGPLRELLHHFKFLGRDYLARWLARESLRTIKLRPDDFDCVIPVPMSPLREWKRGYNQAQLLASQIASEWKLPLVEGVLGCRLWSRSQIRLNRAERKRNVRHRYYGKNRALDFERPLLVDDVKTTGSTLVQCAKVLLDKGAERVEGLVIARDVIDSSLA
jgi:competence protein ComFC